MKKKEKACAAAKVDKKKMIKKAVKAAKKVVKKDKIADVLHEYKEGKLHSGSKKGPLVTNPKQSLAIALSEAKKAVKKVGKKKKK